MFTDPPKPLFLAAVGKSLLANSHLNIYTFTIESTKSREH